MPQTLAPAPPQQQTNTNSNTNNSNQIKNQTVKEPNKTILDAFLVHQFPKPASNKKKEIIANDDYTEDQRDQSWVQCVKGSISFLSALLTNLYGDEGLFREEYFDNYLPFYMLYVFDIHKWIKLLPQTPKEMKKRISDRKKMMDTITRFLNTKKISTRIKHLLAFINKTKISALKELININLKRFTNELTLFIYYTLSMYGNTSQMMTGEQLVHRVLFDDSNTDKCRLIKILIDVGWHHQPYEEFAETVAKIVGYIFTETRRRMLFDNLRVKTLDTMWLPYD